MTTSPEAAPVAEVRETPVLTSVHVGADEVRVWHSGPHVGIYARSPGAEATVSLDREGAWHIASAMVPEIERFRTEHRDAMKAVHELKVEHRPNAVEMLKAVADEIDCDIGCEHSFYDGSCNATECSKHENGDFCGWMMAARLRDLAEGLEIRDRLTPRATQQGPAMSDVISFPGMLRVSGVARISPNKLEVEFDRAVTDDQLINFWLAVKGVTVASVRPDGWQPSDKSIAEEWEPA